MRERLKSDNVKDPLSGRVRAAAVVLCGAVVLTLAPIARADVVVVETRTNSGTEADFQRAKASAADATKAFDRGDVKTALAHAETAYRSYPNASTALVLARIYEAGNNPRKAFEWYLRAQNHDAPESLQTDITKGLTKQGQVAKLGVVRIQVTPKDAKVVVDSTAVPPGTFVGVSFGSHKVQVTASSHEPGAREIDIASAGVQTLQLKLVAVETKSVAGDDSPSLAAPLALIIGGVVVIGVGGGLHAWGLGIDSDLAGRNGKWTAEGLSEDDGQAEFEAMSSDATAGATAAAVMYALGGGLMVAGAILWALQGDGGSGQPNESADVVVRPVFGADSAGVGLSGRF